jgi:RHS repeat-associated protein
MVKSVVDGTLTWLLADHLGSTSVTADASGAFQSEMRYTAFGETRSSSGPTLTDYQYTGQRHEAEFGLYFYKARWYDPASAHFTQADTLIPEPRNPLAVDRYSYTFYNPQKYIDPDGHNPIIGLMLICAGVGALTVEIPQIREHAEKNNMTFLEALTDENLKLDQDKMVNSAIHSAMIPGMIYEGVALGLSGLGSISQQFGLSFNNAKAWNVGTVLQGVAGEWVNLWTTGRFKYSEKEALSVGVDAIEEMDSQAAPGKGRNVKEVPGGNPLYWFNRIVDPGSTIPHRNPKIADQGGLEGTVSREGVIFFRPITSSGNPAIDFHNIPGYPDLPKYHFPK